MRKSEDKSNRTKIIVAIIGAGALIVAAIIGVTRGSKSQLTIRVEDGTGESKPKLETQEESESPVEPEATSSPDPQPTGTNSLSFGQTTSGAITLPAETDMFTFTAETDDTVVIRVSRVSGSFWPEVTLNAPDGSELGTEKRASSVDLREILPVTGIYSILIGDGFDGTDTGEYSINLQKIPKLP